MGWMQKGLRIHFRSPSPSGVPLRLGSLRKKRGGEKPYYFLKYGKKLHTAIQTKIKTHLAAHSRGVSVRRRRLRRQRSPSLSQGTERSPNCHR